jgi:hypothetical protein
MELSDDLSLVGHFTRLFPVAARDFTAAMKSTLLLRTLKSF